MNRISLLERNAARRHEESVAHPFNFNSLGIKETGEKYESRIYSGRFCAVIRVKVDVTSYPGGKLGRRCWVENGFAI